jgi:hypothetical protein
MTNAPPVESAGRPVSGGSETSTHGKHGLTMQRVGQSTREGQDVLREAIRALPIGVCPWGPKFLLLHLEELAGQHGEPPDHVAATHPQLADAIGCASVVTSQDLLAALERAGLVVVLRRLFRGQRDERAPYLADGGTILVLNRERILELAHRVARPAEAPYRPASGPAVEQWSARQHEVEQQLARLRDGHQSLATKLDQVLAHLEAPGARSTEASEAEAEAAEVKAAVPRRRRRVRSGGGEGQGGAPQGAGGGSMGNTGQGGLGACRPLEVRLRGNRSMSASRNDALRPLPRAA